MKRDKIVHDSAELLVTGEAEFIDDRPFCVDEVFVDLIFSTVAHGKIKKIETKEAERVPNLLGIYTYQDLSHNQWGTIFQDQVLLAADVVKYVGEPILILAGGTREAIAEAKRKVSIEYSELPAILSIAEAKKQNSKIGPLRKIMRGDIEKAMADAPHCLSGKIQMAGQDHFYLESQASIAIPKEGGQIEVHSSSQHPSEVQHMVAHALNLKLHQVVCIVKRMGGAFGGKESQAGPFAVYASLVAQKLGRTARMILTKDDDMKITGKRNPFENNYKVGFDQEGRIKALDFEFCSDGGAYADLSTAIMERAMLHCDNAYYIPNLRVTGQVYQTNTASNTAFRGFGGPKGILTIENIMEEIGLFLNKDSFKIRRLNVYQKGQMTHYGQKIEDSVLPYLMKRLYKDSSYSKRKKIIQTHNRSHKSDVRGLSATAVKFGISFTTRFLNQASALVNIHLDGTIQVSTGATEMGQGVNTKIAQVVADTFSIPVSDVKIMPTSTEKNHNTSPTAASSGSDLNGQAARRAALQIKQRLTSVAEQVFARSRELRGRKTAGAGTAVEIEVANLKNSQIVFANGEVYHQKNPSDKMSFSTLVEEAYLNRVALGAYGFYRYPGIFFNKETGQGKPFFYFTNGVAVSEVSVDRLTGEVKVLRSDLLVDLGRPLNEQIDRGQVIGAFVQGLGWLTTENLFYSKKGALLSVSPSTYKIPSIHDIPRDLRVSLLPNHVNQKNLRGSKAVGEPPLMLAISVWTAIKHALAYAKKKNPGLKVPATQTEVFAQLYLQETT